MFGWINDCTECLITSKFGEDIWHQIKEKAGCDVPDGGFLRYKYYPDSDTVQLVLAASEVLGITVDQVLHAFGDYFIDYVKDNGYANVLLCLGKNMRDWLSNLNSLHDHLKASYPEGFVAPVFWSEDDTEFEATSEGNGSNAILVHYFSHRGSLLVPLVVGLIQKLAREYFDIEIDMNQLQLQDEDNGIGHTTWRVTTIDPTEAHKLRGKPKKRRFSSKAGDDETVTVTTTASTQKTNMNPTFREGGAQASNLRVEELVKRSVFNEECDLHFALTLEHFVYLFNYWKKNKINGRMCWELWTLQDADPTSWPQLKDLPPPLHPDTISDLHFGGQVPGTGKFPPTDNGMLPSIPPKIQLVNEITGESVVLTVTKSADVTLQEAIHNAPDVEESGVKSFPGDMQEQIENGMNEIQFAVWNEEEDAMYHTFALVDLELTSTLQLYEMVPNTFDPIKIVVQCAEAVAVDDDEEDI